MAEPVAKKTSYAKIFLGFAVCGVLSLGLCGATLVVGLSSAESTSNTLSVVISSMAVISMIGMAASGLGVLVTGIVWIVSSASRSSNPDKNLPG